MLTYETIETSIREVLTEAKERAGIENLGLSLRRFHGHELGSTWRRVGHRGYNMYPEVSEEGVLLFVGDPQNGIDDYGSRLAYCGLRHTIMPVDELKQDVRTQIKDRIQTKFSDNNTLVQLIQYL